MSSDTKRINLALQGGGSHGAFAWGSLTRVLEQDDLEGLWNKRGGDECHNAGLWSCYRGQ